MTFDPRTICRALSTGRVRQATIGGDQRPALVTFPVAAYRGARRRTDWVE